MTRRISRAALLIGAVALVATACSSSEDRPTGTGTGAPSAAAPSGAASASADTGTGQQSQFFVQADFDRQLAQRTVAPTGPEGEPWRQAIDPEMVDTAKYKKSGNWHVCFSNAGVGNPWRVMGFKTMRAEVKLHKEISKFTVVDAESKDDKQISDIDDLLTQKCDALIISPNTTAALTPAVEKACKSGIPIVVFDRGVESDCPTSFVHPIGGYAYGADTAEFLTKNVKEGGKVIALRILPGVDVLEHRWSAAKVIFDQAKIKVVGVEFTDGDPAKTKTIVADALQKEGTLDGVWMDAGATTVAAVEAFEDAGQEVPPITGEDQNDFLQLWKKDSLPGFSATYPVYQWRTAIIAVADILAGKEVPKEWALPQPTITNDNLDQFLSPGMPPLFYATCGCQKMPGFPDTFK